MTKVEVDIEVDRDGNIYGIVIGKRIDFIQTSRWLWNINNRKIIYEIMKIRMNDMSNKLHFKPFFEEILKEKFGEDLEIDVNRSKVVDVQYLSEDDEIIVKYLLYTKPKKKREEEIIF